MLLRDVFSLVLGEAAPTSFSFFGCDLNILRASSLFFTQMFSSHIFVLFISVLSTGYYKHFIFLKLIWQLIV